MDQLMTVFFFSIWVIISFDHFCLCLTEPLII